MSRYPGTYEFFRKSTIYKVRKFSHKNEIHWNSNESWGQKNVRESLQLTSVMKGMRELGQPGVEIAGRSEGEALWLRISNGQRYTQGPKVQNQAPATDSEEAMPMAVGPKGRALCVARAELLHRLWTGKPDMPSVKPLEHACPGFQAA